MDTLVHKVKMSKILIISIFVSFLFLTPLSSANKADSLNVTIKTDQPQYRWLFDKVKITLTLTNNGTENTAIMFPTSQQFDFIITNKNFKVIFQWSSNKVFSPMMTNITIPAHSFMSWNFIWNKRANIDFPFHFLPVSSGLYHITGVVMAKNISMPYATTNISIGPVMHIFP